MENFDSFGGTKLLWLLPIVALLTWYLWRVPGGRARTLFREVPVIRQTLLALAVVAFLGYALNDSGIAIPAMMAVVFECALVYVVLVRRAIRSSEPPAVTARVARCARARRPGGRAGASAGLTERRRPTSHRGSSIPAASSWAASRALGSA